MPDDDAGRLSRLIDWVRAHSAQPHTLASLARHAGMSIRTLQRQFRETIGASPIDWLVRERIEIAKGLLESTNKPLAQVPALSGFGSDESFRRHFRRSTGISPNAYRKQFGTRRAS